MRENVRSWVHTSAPNRSWRVKRSSEMSKDHLSKKLRRKFYAGAFLNIPCEWLDDTQLSTPYQDGTNTKCFHAIPLSRVLN